MFGPPFILTRELMDDVVSIAREAVSSVLG